jgi:hypothetical protein
MESWVFPLIFSSHAPILKNSFARSVPSQTTEKFNCGKSLCSLVLFIITPKSAVFQCSCRYKVQLPPSSGLKPLKKLQSVITQKRQTEISTQLNLKLSIAKNLSIHSVRFIQTYVNRRIP